jgi:hypothetical protein
MIAIGDIQKDHGTEMAAIILCCRVFFKTATVTELNSFIADNDVDWYLLTRLSLKHRIRPVVYKVMHNLNLDPDIAVLIYKQQANITRKNWKQAIETERIIMLLKAHDIIAVPYKGTAFSQQFFGDMVSREASDIDLIIDPKHLAQAIQILKKDAYKPELDEVYNYLGEKYLSYYKDYNLNKFKDGMREFHVELHWAIAETYLNVDKKVNAFIYRADDSISLAKTNVIALNKLAHFSALLVHHTVKDTFKYLKNIIDISQAFTQPEVLANSAALYKSFIDLGLERSIIVSNQLAKNLIGIYLPEIVYDTAADEATAYFEKQLCAEPVLLVEDNKSFFKWLANRALLQDSFFKKLRFYGVSFRYRFIPTEADFKLIQLPKPVFFIYYLMKPIRSFIRPFDLVARKKQLIPGVPTALR